MTMARSVVHNGRIEVDFPEEQCYPLGIPDLIVQDEDDIPTLVRVSPMAPPKNMGTSLLLLMILVVGGWLALFIFFAFS